MNGAEFKTLREACGLTVPDMARLAISPRTGGAVGDRSVRYWERGSVPVPGDVAALLIGLDDMLSHAAAQALDAWRQNGAAANTVCMVRYRENEDLWRYRTDMKGLPATCHAALINRVRIALNGVGCVTKIVWMEPAEYSRWLDGRQDDEALRAAWAAGR